MSEMKRLLELADRRKAEGDFTHRRVRLSLSDAKLLEEQLEADGLTLNELLQGVVRGYLLRHPAVLAMMDDEKRRVAKPAKKVASLSSREVDDIYAAIGSGMMEQDD